MNYASFAISALALFVSASVAWRTRRRFTLKVKSVTRAISEPPGARNFSAVEVRGASRGAAVSVEAVHFSIVEYKGGLARIWPKDRSSWTWAPWTRPTRELESISHYTPIRFPAVPGVELRPLPSQIGDAQFITDGGSHLWYTALDVSDLPTAAGLQAWAELSTGQKVKSNVFYHLQTPAEGELHISPMPSGSER